MGMNIEETEMFNEITEIEIAEMFNMTLEEFKKEVEEGKIKCWA